MKKLIALIMIAALMVIFVGTAVSAAAPAAPYRRVMAELRKTAAPRLYFAYVESYLRFARITDKQADNLVSYIRTADEAAGSVVRFKNLNGDQKSVILEMLTLSGQELGLKVKYNGSNTLRAYKNNRLVFIISDRTMLRLTGHNYTLLYVGLAIMLMAGITALVLRRQRRQTLAMTSRIALSPTA